MGRHIRLHSIRGLKRGVAFDWGPQTWRGIRLGTEEGTAPQCAQDWGRRRTGGGGGQRGGGWRGRQRGGQQRGGQQRGGQQRGGQQRGGGGGRQRGKEGKEDECASGGGGGAEGQDEESADGAGPHPACSGAQVSGGCEPACPRGAQDHRGHPMQQKEGDRRTFAKGKGSRIDHHDQVIVLM
eukprot:COSAG01_NODE_113_length_25617_cov_10.523492_3_plen_182_part_00